MSRRYTRKRHMQIATMRYAERAMMTDDERRTVPPDMVHDLQLCFAAGERVTQFIPIYLKAARS